MKSASNAVWNAKGLNPGTGWHQGLMQDVPGQWTWARA